jgi:hypothetical protein
MSQPTKFILSEEKYYTFDILDHVNIKLNICNFNESFNNLDEAYLSHSTITFKEEMVEQPAEKN